MTLLDVHYQHDDEVGVVEACTDQTGTSTK